MRAPSNPPNQGGQSTMDHALATKLVRAFVANRAQKMSADAMPVPSSFAVVLIRYSQ
ncbi:MAG: hypothetical protein JO011_04250 [Ktedonobacteraceae bacterium]|nr:hypothetical protein [Ktedonobacteraceae bacterium]MBV9710116.1 hypothetical protein [Ktedonobacteraceae bacterium]